jgi:hypothetical protein
VRLNRFKIVDIWFVALIVGLDLLVMRWAILERESVLSIRGIWCMSHLVAFGAYRLYTRRDSRTPFRVGFIAAGLIATLAYFDLCQLFRWPMIRFQNWMLSPIGIEACHIHFFLAPKLGVTGSITMWTVLIQVALAPVVTFIMALPQIIFALIGGQMAKLVFDRRPRLNLLLPRCDRI